MTPFTLGWVEEDDMQRQPHTSRSFHTGSHAIARPRADTVLTWFLCLLAALLLAVRPALAESSFVLSAELPGVSDGAVAWGDYDGDGDLDLALCGQTDPLGRVTLVLRNDAGSFVVEASAVLPGIYYGSLAWGDYDGDGDLDLLASGHGYAVGPLATIYRNDGDGGFNEETAAALPAVYHSRAVWVDYDGDGDLDVFVCGTTGPTRIARLYRNDGGGVFTWDTLAVFPGVQDGDAAWSDYDGDGDPDLLLTGISSPVRISKLYRNDGGGMFAEETRATLAGVALGTADWADYDGDGDPDILLCGNVGSGAICWVYRNNDGAFARDTDAVLPGTAYGGAAWGDYDNDGDPDILYCGQSDVGKTCRIYRNDGEGAFAFDDAVVLPDVARAAAAWGDYDGDGDLDLVVVGTTGFVRVAEVWNNELVLTTTNQPPVADAGGPYAVELSGGMTVVQLDGTGSTDPDGDSLGCLWSTDQPGASFDDPHSWTPELSFTASANVSFEVDLLVTDGNAVGETTVMVVASDTTPPVLYLPADIAAAPSGPEGVVVEYSPTAVDAVDPYPSVACTPPSGSLFAAGSTTTVICTAMDAAGNASHGSFTVHVLSQAEVVAAIGGALDDLVASGSLKAGQAKGFASNLENILKSLGKTKGNAARGQITGFISKVRDFVASGQLTPEEGQVLLDLASSLLATLD